MNEPARFSDKLREFLKNCQGREVDYKYLRHELHIDPASSQWDGLRTQMLNLVKEKVVKPSGRGDGTFKVIKQVKRVQVFGQKRSRFQPLKLMFPLDFDKGLEFEFAEHIVLRENDIVLIGGQGNFGKTTIALGFCGENIDRKPILMGNEYTIRIKDEITQEERDEPNPRFYNRLLNMDWIEWADEDGGDKFELLPVRADFAEWIQRDRINIIDWINLPADRLYDISKVMDDIKAELGKGIAIVVLQKGDGDMARGGQFTKDFTSCELLIDKFTDHESILTIGKVKEHTAPVMGRTFVFGIRDGVKIVDFREVEKCPACYGKKWKKSGNTSIPCDSCDKTGYVDM